MVIGAWHLIKFEHYTIQVIVVIVVTNNVTQKNAIIKDAEIILKIKFAIKWSSHATLVNVLFVSNILPIFL